MADPNSGESDLLLTFVACVSDEEILRANLLASVSRRGSSGRMVNCLKEQKKTHQGVSTTHTIA
jgi:hypothetical protein